MNLTLSRKVEKALSLDYLPRRLAIDGLAIYEGHESVEDTQIPYLVVYAEDSQTHPEMPSETGIRMARVRMKFVADSADEGRAGLDTWKIRLEDEMNLPQIQGDLNESASRMIKGIHIHYVDMTGEPSDREGLKWEEDMIFDITVEPVAG